MCLRNPFGMRSQYSQRVVDTPDTGIFQFLRSFVAVQVGNDSIRLQFNQFFTYIEIEGDILYLGHHSRISHLIDNGSSYGIVFFRRTVGLDFED